MSQQRFKKGVNGLVEFADRNPMCVIFLGMSALRGGDMKRTSINQEKYRFMNLFSNCGNRIYSQQKKTVANHWFKSLPPVQYRRLEIV